MRRLRLVAAIVAGLILATIAVSAAVQPTALPTTNVTAYDSHGHRLPTDPDVVAGETVVVVATGFHPLELVRVNRPGLRPIVLLADLHGAVRLVYRVPRGLGNGDYSISFVAVTAPAHPQTTPPQPTTGGATDTQYVGANIPRFAVLPFRIGDPGQSTSASVSGTSISHSGAGGGQGGVAVSATTITAGGPAYTGADLLEPLIVGVVGVAAGAVITVVARRRREANHAA